MKTVNALRYFAYHLTITFEPDFLNYNPIVSLLSVIRTKHYYVGFYILCIVNSHVFYSMNGIVSVQ